MVILFEALKTNAPLIEHLALYKTRTPFIPFFYPFSDCRSFLTVFALRVFPERRG